MSEKIHSAPESLSAVLSYTTSGNKKACGQTVGANGAGDFCVLFFCDKDQAYKKATKLLKEMESSGHKITASIFVENDDNYAGNTIKKVENLKKAMDCVLSELEQ